MQYKSSPTGSYRLKFSGQKKCEKVEALWNNYESLMFRSGYIEIIRRYDYPLDNQVSTGWSEIAR